MILIYIRPQPILKVDNSLLTHKYSDYLKKIGSFSLENQ